MESMGSDYDVEYYIQYARGDKDDRVETVVTFEVIILIITYKLMEKRTVKRWFLLG